MSEQLFEARMQKLERANEELRRQMGELRRSKRRAWIAGIAVLALVAVAGAAGFSGDSFQLLSPTTNKVRISSAMSAQGKTAGLIFTDDKNATRRMFIGHSEQDNPSFILYAPDGQMARMEFLVGSDNSITETLYGRNGKQSLRIGVNDGNLPQVNLYGTNGNLRAALEVSPNSKGGGLMCFDKDEHKRIFVGVDSNEEPVVRFWDADGKWIKDLKP